MYVSMWQYVVLVTTVKGFNHGTSMVSTFQNMVCASQWHQKVPCHLMFFMDDFFEMKHRCSSHVSYKNSLDEKYIGNPKNTWQNRLGLDRPPQISRLELSQSCMRSQALRSAKMPKTFRTWNFSVQKISASNGREGAIPTSGNNFSKTKSESLQGLTFTVLLLYLCSILCCIWYVCSWSFVVKMKNLGLLWTAKSKVNICIEMKTPLHPGSEATKPRQLLQLSTGKNYRSCRVFWYLLCKDWNILKYIEILCMSLSAPSPSICVYMYISMQYILHCISRVWGWHGITCLVVVWDA